MADEELDALYVVPPEAFTAERTRLAKAAKSRGDADAAKRISAARKPTTVAWTANLLALRHPDAVQRLAALGDRLQQAHTEMDGAKIRELSAKQRALIEELSKDAFKLASESGNVKTPSATLRDDLTGTLQAAIADAEVRGRLGRLTKAEQWSGFGGFGEAAPAPSRKESRKEKPKPSASARDDSKRADSKDDKARQKAQERRNCRLPSPRQSRSRRKPTPRCPSCNPNEMRLGNAATMLRLRCGRPNALSTAPRLDMKRR